MHEKNIAQVVVLAQEKLGASDSSRLDVEVLLSEALICDRSYLYTWPDKALTPAQLEFFSRQLARRASGEPIAYIVGKKEFWSLMLEVDNSTLIPRPETELLVEVALQKIPETHCQIIDLGTGTGAIALALAKERPQWQVSACDASMDAVKLAKRNADNLHITNVTIFVSNWFDVVTRHVFDLVISNPPYIDEQDMHLAQGDVRFEPKSALVAANKGFADIEKIIKQSATRLKPGGWLMLEHGFAQAEQVRNLFKTSGYVDIETVCDLAGHERVTIARQVTGGKLHG